MKNIRLPSHIPSHSNLVFLALLILTALIGMALIPHENILPIHWNFSGRPDLFAPAWIALLIPAFVGVACLALIYFFTKEIKGDRAIRTTFVNATVGLLLLIELTLVAIGLGIEVEMPRIICFGLAVVLISTGNIIPKSQPGGLAGLKLPWNAHDSENWAITHRWLGRFFVLSGLVLLIVGLVGVKTPVIVATILLAGLFPALAATIISYTNRRPKS